MNYRVCLHKHAVNFFGVQDAETKNRLKEGLGKLKSNPLESDVKKFKSTKGKQDLYRLRIGDYQAIFSIEDDIVYVLEIIPREYGYKWL